MAHVRRARSGKGWEARYRDPAGHERSRSFHRKLDAEQFLARETSDMQRGAWADPRMSRITFAEWSARYFAGALHKRPTTLARDACVLRKHLVPALGVRPLSSITPLDVRRLVEQMSARLAPGTVRTNYAVLRAVLTAAVDADLLVRSPCRGIKLPKEARREIRFLSPEELHRLADAVAGEYRPLVYVAGVLGLRWSEIAGLRVKRLNFFNDTLEVAETLTEVEGQLIVGDVKTRAGRRTIGVPPFLMRMLGEHLARRGLTAADGDALVFVTPQDGPLRGHNFRNRVWAPAVRTAGLTGLTPHGLRHTAAALLIDLKAPEHALQERLGHSSSRVTRDVYGHVLPATDHAVTAGLEALLANAPRDSRGISAGSGGDDNDTGGRASG